ncbi:hypothetical protein ACFSKU_04165 [Pontibacter silvestris]|uniref:Uncharacterized protein n=1 Tax=Pontibacter silvestris TaxID=2305183 RepID=A0ABW4WTI0_9BACT|nr:hypothetical protein [Pontibacter silvestris]MCC9138632.1 hypothetical protein [Pontibacter silvestris]
MYLNEVSHVKGFEVEVYLKNIDENNGCKYKNFLCPRQENTIEKPKKSLETALELWESQASCEAKLMVVVKAKR